MRLQDLRVTRARVLLYTDEDVPKDISEIREVISRVLSGFALSVRAREDIFVVSDRDLLGEMAIGARAVGKPYLLIVLDEAVPGQLVPVNRGDLETQAVCFSFINKEGQIIERKSIIKA